MPEFQDVVLLFHFCDGKYIKANVLVLRKKKTHKSGNCCWQNLTAAPMVKIMEPIYSEK